MPADQVDILLANEKLTKDLATANSNLAILTGERDAARASLLTANASILAVTGERDSAKAATVAVTTERDTLKGENEKLKGDMADFNKKLAGELAKHGVAPSAIATNANTPAKGAAGAGEKAMTVTEVHAAIAAGTIDKATGLELIRASVRQQNGAAPTRLNYVPA